MHIDRLDAAQLRTLIEELRSLNQEQNEARQTEIYIRMTALEHEAFDNRTQRISRIYAILSQPGNWARAFMEFEASPFVTAAEPRQ